jgi:hypothetical protein
VASFGGINLVAATTTLTVVSWNVWLVVIARRRLGLRCYPRVELLRRPGPSPTDQ